MTRVGGEPQFESAFDICRDIQPLLINLGVAWCYGCTLPQSLSQTWLRKFFGMKPEESFSFPPFQMRNASTNYHMFVFIALILHPYLACLGNVGTDRAHEAILVRSLPR